MRYFDSRNSGYFTEEGLPIPQGSISEPRHCWGINCDKSTDMYPGIGDPPYGFVCKKCGQSLRTHPFFGQGRQYDHGNMKCINTWDALSKTEKAQVYLRFNFPVPKWLR